MPRSAALATLPVSSRPVSLLLQAFSTYDTNDSNTLDLTELGNLW